MADCESKVGFYVAQIDKMSQLLGDVRHGVESLQEAIQSSPRGDHADQSSKPAASEGETPIASEEKRVEFATVATPGPSEANLLTTLGQIEQKTNELLTLHLAVNAPKSRNQIVIGEDGLPKEVSSLPAGTVGGLLGQGPTAPIGRLTILAPSTGYLLLFTHH